MSDYIKMFLLVLGVWFASTIFFILIAAGTASADATVITWSQAGSYYQPMTVGTTPKGGYITRLKH